MGRGLLSEDAAFLDEGLEVESVAATEIASLARILEALWGVRELFNSGRGEGALDNFFAQYRANERIVPSRPCDTFQGWTGPAGR